MRAKTRLINFNVPKDLKDQFDTACQILGISRTKILIEMIEAFLIDNEGEIANEAKRKLELKEAAKRTLRFKEFLDRSSASSDDGPPEFFVSTHQE